jgi:general secretion pathway protein K
MNAPFSDGGRDRERGMALLVVLWGVTAAALLVSAFNVTARSGANFMSSEIELTKAEALADAGLEIAAAHLIDQDQARRWRPDGRPRSLALGDGAKLTITIDDPNGLINVNKAQREVLLGLLSRAMGRPEDAEALVQGIMELRGKPPTEAGDSAPEARAAPETPEVTTETPAASPTATQAAKPRIADVTQLRRMNGMTPELFRQIAPYLTVHSRDGRINPFHAPRAVMLAIPGLSEIDVDRFLDSARVEGSDDRPVPSSLGKAGALLANQTGPAYFVSVAVGWRGRSFVLGRHFVIAPGLDPAAPYRLLATRPLSADSFLLQDRVPRS